jgi:hypothetical protein
MLTPESQAKLDVRIQRGRALIAKAWDVAAIIDNEDDFDSASRDAISDILTARFGAAGKLTDDGFPNQRTRVVLNSVAVEDASALMDAALQSYFGDAEDYVEADEPQPEPGQYGYEESHEDRVVELEAFLQKVRKQTRIWPGKPIWHLASEIDTLID